MNDSTTAPARKTRRQGSATIHPATDPVQVRFGQLAAALGAAHRTDEPDAKSGDSTRLLRVAYQLAERQHATMADLSEATGFDIAALLAAARRVPGDQPMTQARADLLGLAAVIVAEITDCTDLLPDDQPPKAIAEAPSAKPAVDHVELRDRADEVFRSVRAVLLFLVDAIEKAECPLRDLPGVVGAMQYVKYEMAALNTAFDAQGGGPLGTLYWPISDAASILEVVDQSEFCRGFSLDYTPAIYVDVLNAARHAIQRGKDALATIEAMEAA